MSDSTDLTDEQAHKIVLSISRSKGWVRPELRGSQNPEHRELLESLRGVREELGDVLQILAQDIYSLKSRFILELIQNAEDCEFSPTNNTPSISFDVTLERIIVEYNERGFTEMDVRQICHTGKSWKKSRPGYIGEKGIGFKSVFQAASKVHIQSNAFAFSFEYNGGIDSEEKLGIITPIPEDDPIPPSERPLTRMVLSLNDRIPYGELVSHFTTIPDSLLLFLSKLREIKVTIHFPDQARTTVTTFRKLEDEAAGVTRLFKLSEHSNTPEELRYYISKTLVSKLPKDDSRPDINECEVVLAFPVDDERDRPRISIQHDVFAFLPVCHVGFNFLVQADFILQASRQEVMVDSARNRAIITHIAIAFRTAILNFCTMDSLKFHWVRYLPVGRDFDFNPLWKKLSSNIVALLKQERILYPNDHSQCHQPEDLRTLPTLPVTYLDRTGSPLFMDRPGRNRKYLSLQYDPRDVTILKTAFHINDIEDIHMFHRIKQDLESSTSRMKGTETDADWHIRAADLITYILERSPEVGRMMAHELDLIPLSDGRWVTASAEELFFPSQHGPKIPEDLVVTIHPEAVRNPSRKTMFSRFGAIDCPPERVINRLWTSYLQQDGASSLAASKAHLGYLYWHCADIENARFGRLWLYDDDLRKVTSRRKVIYLPSEDEYGPRELLKAVQDYRSPGRLISKCPVSFVNPEYIKLFDSSTMRHGLSWLEWLQAVLGVRRIPRLKYDAGSLSAEFRHIIQFRPEKIIGTLKTYWATYRGLMTNAIQDEISQAIVACLHAPLAVLSCTYCLSPNLTQKAQELGVLQNFPFLDIPDLSEEARAYEEWSFLARFGVRFDADLAFYLDILRLHKARRHQPWNSDTRNGILKTYELISDHCKMINRGMLLDTFDRDGLILHPCAFQPNCTTSRWLEPQNCVWRGPENLLDKTPLATVASYRNNQKLVHLFCDVLNIKNTNWKDYMDMLLKLRRNDNSPPDLPERVLRLYELLSKSRISNEDWSWLVNTFQNEQLIYVSSGPSWYAPSQCLWTSPVPIEGKAIISGLYPDELKPFFLERLKISPASLNTLVEGLCALAEAQPSVADIKQMIWAINAMDPKKGDLSPLVHCNILPVRAAGASSSDEIFFQNCQSNFVIIDRMKLADIFMGHVGFLAFSLEDIRQLAPFLEALRLTKKYLSCICIEDTACDEEGVLDMNLTDKFKDSAYYLLRCAVSHRSPLAVGDARQLYDRLLASTVYKTDRISTQYTIQQDNGDTIGPITRGTGYVHIREHDNSWQIFIPRNRQAMEICYIRELPDALAKLFKIALSARENISHVLNSSSLVIDDLLERAGIGNVPGIEPRPRRVVEDTDEPARSAPLLDTRRSSQSSPLNESGLENGATVDIEIDATVSRASQLSLGASEQPNTPSSSVSGEINVQPIVQPIAQPINLPSRSPSPAYSERNELYTNTAYRELLDHVIRIASQTDLPHHNALEGPINGHFHQGFDHQAAFGIRSQEQMNHDTKIGAAGELFVFEVLLNLALPVFDRSNWRSTIRKEVTIHPRYSDMDPWPYRRETSDIVYRDVDSRLTEFLVRAGYLNNIWRGATPEYFIEVKTTTGNCGDRFFLSANQYRMMQDMALVYGRTSASIYLICRVYNLGRENLRMKIYVDPEAHRGRNLIFEANTWTVTER